MLFSSITFLYVFLLLFLAMYFLVKDRYKNVVLLVFSLFFYFYSGPIYFAIMILVAFVGYLFGLVLADKPKLLGLAVGMCFVPLFVFKYTDFFILNINGVLQTQLPYLRFVLPVGISFYSFQIVSYLIDVKRKACEPQRNYFSFLMYVSLFPQLIAGPIVRYQDVQKEMEHRVICADDVADGMLRFSTGLAKKVLIADALYPLVSLSGTSVLASWMKAVAFTLQIYFDFSGYSDMAIGLGRIMGFHFLENFNYPYISKSVTEFWRRWHISLGSWFRDYVYIPMGGNRCSKPRWIFNIVVVWFLTGFWHGASYNFIAWGLYFAAILLVEKLWLKPYLDQAPTMVSTCYTMFLVVLGFVLFHANDMSEAIVQLKNMFGFAQLPMYDVMTLYYLRSNAILLVCAIVGCTPLVKMRGKNVSKQPYGFVLEALYVLAVLILVSAYLVDGSFSPFLYFRF